MPSTREIPVVSVLMITYMHERFIAQAIESVLMQETDFSFELIIGEDKSSDATLDIVRRYEAAHPGEIRVLARDRNLGMMENLIDTYSACRGRYVALLEGDDYWTDRAKLQIQVEALDSHTDWSLCFHRARYVSEDGSQVFGLGFEDIRPITTLADLLDRNYIPTLSIMFPRALIDTFPPWYRTLQMGDWPLTILLARRGNIGFLERIMGDYRVHPGGVYSGATERSRLSADVAMYREIRPILDSHLAPLVSEQIIRRAISIAACDLSARKYVSAARVLLTLLRSERWSLLFPMLARAVARRSSRPLVESAGFRNTMPLALQRAIKRMTRQ
jgi:glycosyltransferase involved in cell wall biosynthesis